MDWFDWRLMVDAVPHRRNFLSACTIGLLALISGTVIAPVVAFVTNPLRRKSTSPETGVALADAGALESLPSGQWNLVPIEIIRQDGWAKSHESRSVWVKRTQTGSDGVIVLSPICTHLGCPIALPSGSTEFRCPCHGGVFDADGKHVAGPPPRDMDSLDFEMRDGRLWVRWQDFKTGVPDRISVKV